MEPTAQDVCASFSGMRQNSVIKGSDNHSFATPWLQEGLEEEEFQTCLKGDAWLEVVN